MASEAVLRNISAPSIPLSDGAGYDIVVLPREIDESGVARYHESAADLVKALRFEDLKADYADGPDQRTWIGEKSSAQYILDVVLNMVSSGAYDGLKALLLRRHSVRSVRVRLARHIPSPNGEITEWVEIEGTGSDVAEILKQLNLAPAPQELSE